MGPGMGELGKTQQQLGALGCPSCGGSRADPGVRVGSGDGPGCHAILGEVGSHLPDLWTAV